MVDAHGSGPCGGDPVEVQVLFSAPSLTSLQRHGSQRRPDAPVRRIGLGMPALRHRPFSRVPSTTMTSRSGQRSSTTREARPSIDPENVVLAPHDLVRCRNPGCRALTGSARATTVPARAWVSIRAAPATRLALQDGNRAYASSGRLPNGHRITTFSARSGPVETRCTGTSTRRSRRSMYSRAAAGRSSSDVTPAVLERQPGIVS